MINYSITHVLMVVLVVVLVLVIVSVGVGVAGDHNDDLPGMLNLCL
jgi:uncharacterized Tic20 family protein